MLSSGTLLNPLRLNGFLNAATSSLQVDETLQLNDLKNIALRMRNFKSNRVAFTTVPVADLNHRTPAGASVVLLDEQGADEMFDALRRDEAPTAAAKPRGGKLTVPPADIRVRVFNGSGVAGQARKAFTALADAGFRTTGVPDNRGTDVTTTVVTHGPGRSDAARTLAAALPGAVIQEDPSLTETLEVVVGKDYTRVKKVTVTGASPSASPGTIAAPGVQRTADSDLCAGSV